MSPWDWVVIGPTTILATIGVAVGLRAEHRARRPRGVPSAMPSVLRASALDDDELDRMARVALAIQASGRMQAHNDFIEILKALREARRG